MTIIAASNTQALWYLTRGSGVVALVLLTLSLVAGIADVQRLRTAQLPRFVVDALHRTLSLLAIAFVAIHVVTSLLDSFAPIALADVFIPFVSAYRPIWLGLGAIAFDLMLAIAITSLLRQRIGHRTWRAVHWASYGSWPIAIVHEFGSGSDARGAWMLLITAACLVSVIAAALTRLRAGWPEHREVRLAGFAACAAVPAFLVVWLPGGPLAHGWARRAGTPASLLKGIAASSAATGSAAGASGSGATASSGGGATSTTTPAGSAGGQTAASFTAPVSGTVRQGETANGLAVVDIRVAVSGQRLDQLRIRLIGEPVAGGGVEMTSGRVSLGPSSNPDEFHGSVTSLSGTDVRSTVGDSAGTVLHLDAALQVPPAGGAVSGTLSAAPR